MLPATALPGKGQRRNGHAAFAAVPARDEGGAECDLSADHADRDTAEAR